MNYTQVEVTYYCSPGTPYNPNDEDAVCRDMTRASLSKQKSTFIYSDTCLVLLNALLLSLAVVAMVEEACGALSPPPALSPSFSDMLFLLPDLNSLYLLTQK